MKKIENDEQYQRGLAWMITEAARLETLEIDDKLMLPEKRAELMKAYNKSDEAIQHYRRTKTVARFPDMAEHYRKLGQSFDEPAAEPAPEKNYAAFLDE